MSNHVNSGTLQVATCQSGTIKIVVIALTAMTLLGGCTKTDKTVEYYKKNTREMERTLAECKNNVGTFIMRPECKNVEKAKEEIELEKSRDQWNPNRGMSHF